MTHFLGCFDCTHYLNWLITIPAQIEVRLLDRGGDIVTVKELLGHSTVLVTMRCLHPNLDAKVQAVAKLAANCDDSVTVRSKVQQLIPKVSQSRH